LSDTRNPLNMQKHISKCFEGIDKLQFNDKIMIVGMTSSEGEKIPFTNPIDPKAIGNVEMWLAAVE